MGNVSGNGAALAFYGDSVGDEVAAGRMLFAVTRKENAVTPIDLNALQPLKPIPLPHRPRSSQGSARGLVLVSGADKPQTSVVDLAAMQVVRTVGVDVSRPVEDFGGSLASGHERWLPDSARFFLLDRAHRTIAVYRADSGEKVWAVNTPTAVHHLVPDPGTANSWLAVCEGNPASRVPPSIMAIVEGSPGFTVAAHMFLPVPEPDVARMGSHHLDFHPDKRHIYIGSNEGRCYVVDRQRMEVAATIATGLGHGHTGFARVGGATVAVSVNHIDRHVSLMDADTHQLLDNVTITSQTPTGSQRTQGHTTIVRNGKFYVMAALDATFVEIDLASRKVTRTLKIPRKQGASVDPVPMQGTFVASSGALATNCC